MVLAPNHQSVRRISTNFFFDPIRFLYKREAKYVVEVEEGRRFRINDVENQIRIFRLLDKCSRLSTIHSFKHFNIHILIVNKNIERISF